MKLVDLTVIIEHNSKSEPFPAKITLHDHKSSAKNYGAKIVVDTIGIKNVAQLVGDICFFILTLFCS